MQGAMRQSGELEDLRRVCVGMGYDQEAKHRDPPVSWEEENQREAE